MYKTCVNRWGVYLPALAVVLILASCGNVKKIQYIQGPYDTARVSNITIPEPVVQPNDLLGIIVYSDNPAATALYNQPITKTAEGAGEQTPGYLVDKEGNIQFQGLGKLHVAGLTKKQIADLLDSHLKDKYLKNPYYNIRFLNYKITMIGDVAKPGVYNIPSEKVNILEAVGMAGDITSYGRREFVTIIRENDGKREIGSIDLTKGDVFHSPYFNLQQNDVVIVNPTKNKSAATDQVALRNFTLIASLLSTTAVLINIFTR